MKLLSFFVLFFKIRNHKRGEKEEDIEIYSLKSRFAGHHVLGTESREMESFEEKLLDARASFNADRERLEENVESGAESTQPEANENEDQEPQDAPDETTSITSCTAVTFTCHRLCFFIGMSSGAANLKLTKLLRDLLPFSRRYRSIVTNRWKSS